MIKNKIRGKHWLRGTECTAPNEDNFPWSLPEAIVSDKNAAPTPSVEVPSQVVNKHQTHGLIYLGGNVKHAVNLSIKRSRLLHTQHLMMMQLLPDVYPQNVRSTERSSSSKTKYWRKLKNSKECCTAVTWSPCTYVLNLLRGLHCYCSMHEVVVVCPSMTVKKDYIREREAQNK